MTVKPCTEACAGEILAILNEAIETSTALYDYVPRPPEAMVRWFEGKRAGRFPVIGAFADDGVLAGFASYGAFRERPAYKYSVEHSVYVHRDHRGCGVGEALLRALIAAAQEQEYHLMIGAIDAANAASVGLHRKLGFVHCGTVREAGFKFGRWLNVDFYQLILPTPARPIDG